MGKNNTNTTPEDEENKNKKHPLVSILIPTYNWEQYIERSLVSVLQQNYPNMNIIITDDWSKDNTLQTITNFKQNNDPNDQIHIIKNKINKWIAWNMNIWLQQSDGKYIAILDQDDIRLDQSKLIKQINFLEKNPDHWIIWTNVEVDQIDKKNPTNYPLSNENIQNVLLWICPFLHSSVVYNKSLALDVKWYSSKYKYAMDYEFFMELMKQSKWANLPDITTSYQMHWNNISKKHKLQQLKEILAITTTHKNDFPNWTKSLIYQTINLLSFALCDNNSYEKLRPWLKQKYIQSVNK